MENFLSCMDLNLALRMKQPPSLTEFCTFEQRKYYKKWDRLNHMSLMMIKCGILEVFIGNISKEITNTKDFLAEIEKQFAKSDKAEINSLLPNLISMKYQGVQHTRWVKLLLSTLLLILHELPSFSEILMHVDFLELVLPVAALEVGIILLHFLLGYPLDLVELLLLGDYIEAF
ncbi:hypothetical protein KIW84_056987 [Lathyrus oleraceus]|uniref:Uncharacterized protein n=1 Tax=Pisum sativum TaxID=3888 RepID=A0A9D4X0Y7_PEA|nr:hypothetical protein KIW84_056987 [Pisum sativum]